MRSDTEKLGKLINCLKSQFELWQGQADRETASSTASREKYHFAAHQNFRALQEIGLGHGLVCKCAICDIERTDAQKEMERAS